MREAEAELQTRIAMERGSGGGLHNISNPYLQRLVGESDLRLDIDRVASGTGERYRFLTTVLPRLRQMESEMVMALSALDVEIGILIGEEEVSQEALRMIYTRASLAVPAERIREVQGSFTVQVVDPFILDTSPLQEEEYWQHAMVDLVKGQASAIIFAFMAVFVDLMVVFFAFVAAASPRASVAPRLSLRHWFDLAYGNDAALGMRRWLEALSGERVVQGNAVLHEIEPQRLARQRDESCARFLRQDGYLRRLRTPEGRVIWCLHDEAYGALIKQVRRARPATVAAATVAPQSLAVTETADV